MLDTEKTIAQSEKPIVQSEVLRFGLIGTGAMGRHHARILTNLLGIHFVGMHDLDSDAGRDVSQNVGAPFFDNVDELLGECQAIIIATPPSEHFDIACRAIRAGKDCFIEKPLADTAARARKIVQLSAERGRHVVVGHVERFNPVIRWFKQNLNPADILSINITRVGPRPPRIKDVGIVVDLAVHDIDLISHLSQSRIAEIQAMTRSTSGPREDVAQVNLKTASGVVCSITTNWLTPYKSRKMEIATPSDFYVGDLVAGTVSHYDGIHGQAVERIVDTRPYPNYEPLMEQTMAFLNLIRGEGPATNASVEEGCQAVELALRCLG